MIRDTPDLRAIQVHVDNYEDRLMAERFWERFKGIFGDPEPDVCTECVLPTNRARRFIGYTEYWCEACLDLALDNGDVHACESTGRLVADSDAVYCEDINGYVHEDYAYRHSDGCYYSYEEEDEARRDRILSGYHSGPRDTGDVQPYDIGVELEVDTHDLDDMEEIVNNFPLGFSLEEDGSLDDTGMEIVQVKPKPLDKTKGHWDKVFPLLPSQKGRRGYGMHVSICHDGWSEEHLSNFVAFWSIHEDLVTHFATRRYCTSYAIKSSYDKDEKDEMTYEAKQSRYMACALRGNGRAEVRVFQTTRERARFNARVELVDAVARWTAKKGMEVDDINTTWGGLWTFLVAHKAKYPDALRMLDEWINSTKGGDEECV